MTCSLSSLVKFWQKGSNGLFCGLCYTVPQPQQISQGRHMFLHTKKKTVAANVSTLGGVQMLTKTCCYAHWVVGCLPMCWHCCIPFSWGCVLSCKPTVSPAREKELQSCVIWELDFSHLSLYHKQLDVDQIVQVLMSLTVIIQVLNKLSCNYLLSNLPTLKYIYGQEKHCLHLQAPSCFPCGQPCHLHDFSSMCCRDAISEDGKICRTAFV